MAAGLGLTPEQRQALLNALIQGGNSGMTDPMAALRNIMTAQGGPSAAQAIVAGLQSRLMPQGGSGPAGPAGPTSPATIAARGLSGEEPNYAKIEPDKPSGILEEQKPAPKTDDIADAAKKLAEKTPAPATPTTRAAPAARGILGDVKVPPVPDVPDAGTSVRRAVGQASLPGSQRELLTRMVMMESTGQPQAGKEAVAHVILNRVADGRYGDGVQGVITRQTTTKSGKVVAQFEPWGNPRTRAAMMATPTDSRRYQEAKAAVDRVLSGESQDPTNGATHFLNKTTSAARGDSAMKPGGWGRTGRDQIKIGDHTFMKADAGRGPGPGPVGREQLANRENLLKDFSAPTTEPSGSKIAPSEDVPLPPARPKGLLADDSQPTTTPAPEPDTPTTDADLGPDFGAEMDTGGAEDLGSVGAEDQGDLGGEGLGGLGGLLGGGGESGGESAADSGPSMLEEWGKQDAAEERQAEKQPDRPIIPDEDKQAGGILSGGGLLGDQDQGRVDLARVFSPEGMGGTGLLGGDQGPDASGFKAPIGLPAAGPGTAATAPPTAGILGGAPRGDISSIVPPSLRSSAPAAPLSPPRPAGLDATIQAPQISPPTIQPPKQPDVLVGPGSILSPDTIRQARQMIVEGLEGSKWVGDRPGPTPAQTPADAKGPIIPLPQTAEEATATPPLPQPPSVGGGWRLPRREGQPDASSGGIPVPTPPSRPNGILGGSPAPSPPAVDPDRMLRDNPLSPPPVDPNRMQRDNPLLSPPAVDPQRMLRDDPKTGILGMSSTSDQSGIDDAFSRLAKGSGLLSSGLGLASSGVGTTSSRPKSQPASLPPSRPMLSQDPLLASGLLSNARQGINLNRFFGLLSGRIG
jgi:N-acetylmuramoyl-L-alanine amidase